MDGKRAELRAEIEARPVPVPKLGRDELLRCAIEDYNGRASARAGWNGREATADSDPAFLARIAVNYVRHSLTRYERDLDRLAGKIGRGEGERLIRRKAYAAIAEAYPHLAAECGRQLAEREAYDDAPPPDAEPRR
jgi:hypothetical protein